VEQATELMLMLTAYLCKWFDSLPSFSFIPPFSALQWIFPVVLLAGLSFAPESPWWLVRKGRIDDARKVITRLGGPTIDAGMQLQQIQDTIELEDSYAASARYIDCFRGLFHSTKILDYTLIGVKQGSTSDALSWQQWFSCFSKVLVCFY
jgi:hypothetical protein